jgi:hypothetical protein
MNLSLKGNHNEFSKKHYFYHAYKILHVQSKSTKLMSKQKFKKRSTTNKVFKMVYLNSFNTKTMT